MKKILSIIKYILFLSVGVGLLYLAFKDQDIEKMIGDLKAAEFGWIWLSLVIVTISHISRAARWNILIKPLGYQPKLYHTTLAVFIAYFVNLVFPRLGEVFRCGILKRTDKIPMDSLIGTVVVERTIDFLTLLFILSLSVLFQFELVSSFFIEKIVMPLFSKMFSSADQSKIFLIILGFLILLIGFLAYLFRDRIKNSTIFQKIRKLTEGFIQGIMSIKNMENKHLFVAHSLLIWTGYFVMMYVCFFSLNATSHLSLMAAMFIFGMGGVGMAVPVQGGIGTFHWTVAQTMVLYGVAQSDGLVFATILHTAHAFYTIICGSIAMLLVVLIERKISSSNTKNIIPELQNQNVLVK